MPTPARHWRIPGSSQSFRRWATTPWTCRRKNYRSWCAARWRTTRRCSKRPASSRSSEAFEGHAGEALQFLERKSVDHIHDVKPIGLHVEHGEIGVDTIHAARAGEGVGAALHDLAFALLR